MNSYPNSYNWYWHSKPEKPEKHTTESVEEKLDILLEVFAPQVDEIREMRYQQRLEKYAHAHAEWDVREAKAREHREAVDMERAETEKRKGIFVAEYNALDNVGDAREYAAVRLSYHFTSVEEVRNAPDHEILRIDGIGWKSLEGIRQRTHEHKWEVFETESGKAGSYCEGCKARTGFVTC